MHRAILGSVERFMAILTEHLGGKWPFWISPRQIIVCPISEKAADYCHSVYLYFHKLGYEAQYDRSQGAISKKVRNAQLAQWNFILVAGEDEMAAGLVDVRTRDNQRIGKYRVDDFAEHLKTLALKQSTSHERMYAKAWDPSQYARGDGAGSAGKAAGAGAGGKSGGKKSGKASAAKLDELDAKLRDSGAMWFSGAASPSAADREALEALAGAGGQVDPKVHPHLFGWYSLASKFSDKIKANWK